MEALSVQGISSTSVIKCYIAQGPQLDLQAVKGVVLNILASVGFRDIQRDWIDVDYLAPDQMQATQPGAQGFHIASNVFDEHIRVIDNLTWQDLYATLAHEYLHAWQMQNETWDFVNYNNSAVAKNTCEGFAQIGAFVVYQYFGRHQDAYSSKKVLGMLCATDPAYGLSFQELYKRANGGVDWAPILREARKKTLQVHV